MITGLITAYDGEFDTIVITKRISVNFNNYIQPIAANDLTTKSYVDDLVSSSAKLNSANTFTELQTINGNLKADYVLVKKYNSNLILTCNLKIICRYCFK